MTFDTIIGDLLAEFPELTDRYREDKPDYEDLPHLVFAYIFVPYIIELANRSGTDGDLIRVFRFVERMHGCLDGKVRELAVVSLLENLQVQTDELTKLCAYFGPETAKWFSEWGPELPLCTNEQ